MVDGRSFWFDSDLSQKYFWIVMQLFLAHFYISTISEFQCWLLIFRIISQAIIFIILNQINWTNGPGFDSRESNIFL